MTKRESVINTDRFDRRRFGQILDMSERLQELEKKGQEVLPTFRPLMTDLWASLYKMKPSLLKEEEFDKEYQTNHDLMKRIISEEGYLQARSATKLDDLSSALGTIRFSEKVHEWVEEQKSFNDALRDALEEAMKAQQSLNHAQQKQQEAQEKILEAEKNSDSKARGIAKRRQTKANKQVNKAQVSLDQAMQQVQSQLFQSLSEGRKRFSQAIADASQEAHEAKVDLVNLLAGGSGAGVGESELQKLPLRDQIKLAGLLSKNKKMKEIADWAGRFKAIARKKQKNKQAETIDRSGVTLGIDVERLLPSELVAYKNPLTKLDFLRRYAEGQTMTYAREGKETLGKGPIILCLDQSGSMANIDGQSKGFALALMMIAKRQRRDFAIIPFSSASKQKMFFYEKGKMKPSDLVNLAETFLGGGTSFTPPLQKAVNIIEGKKLYSKADIVFVTDGDPGDKHALLKYISLEDGMFTKKRKEKNFNVISVLIGQSVSESNVKLFSDKIVWASDFQNESVANAIFTI